MTLERSVLETFRERAQIDREFREGCLQDTVEILLSGDAVDGLMSLHDHIYATIGFEEVGKALGMSPDDLAAMLLPTGEAPPASAVFEMIGLLREDEGVEFEVSVVRRDGAGGGADEREAVAAG